MACLVCEVTNCTYNEKYCCCKGDIMVGGRHADQEDDTCCESFRNVTGDFFKSAMDHPSIVIHIDCEAVNCVYNSGYRCHADKVAIKGNGADDSQATLCATFKER
ncbi:MAG: DUF1540 domain-containing protein [Lachnospiraceae bacterium]|nr:DUF1540 domain-containing protein [Lachnospiraceae bacterium]